MQYCITGILHKRGHATSIEYLVAGERASGSKSKAKDA